jgi:hypothetical protein
MINKLSNIHNIGEQHRAEHKVRNPPHTDVNIINAPSREKAVEFTAENKAYERGYKNARNQDRASIFYYLKQLNKLFRH